MQQKLSKKRKSVKTVQYIREKQNFWYLLKGSDKEILKVSNVKDNMCDMDDIINLHWKVGMNSNNYCE